MLLPKNEDNKLREHFQRLCSRGTGFVKPERLTNYGMKIHFRSKKKNVNGLQLADMVAYPCSTFVKDEKRPNPSFDVISGKIYTKNEKRYGFKVYP